MPFSNLNKLSSIYQPHVCPISPLPFHHFECPGIWIKWKESSAVWTRGMFGRDLIRSPKPSLCFVGVGVPVPKHLGADPSKRGDFWSGSRLFAFLMGKFLHQMLFCSPCFMTSIRCSCMWLIHLQSEVWGTHQWFYSESTSGANTVIRWYVLW